MEHDPNNFNPLLGRKRGEFFRKEREGRGKKRKVLTVSHPIPHPEKEK